MQRVIILELNHVKGDACKPCSINLHLAAPTGLPAEIETQLQQPRNPQVTQPKVPNSLQPFCKAITCRSKEEGLQENIPCKMEQLRICKE